MLLALLLQLGDEAVLYLLHLEGYLVAFLFHLLPFAGQFQVFRFHVLWYRLQFFLSDSVADFFQSLYFLIYFITQGVTLVNECLRNNGSREFLFLGFVFLNLLLYTLYLFGYGSPFLHQRILVREPLHELRVVYDYFIGGNRF